jgi:hypothetical protein
MDYEFFQMLSERIDRARGDGRERLIKLRDQLLEMTRTIDQQMEARLLRAKQLLNTILLAGDIKEATVQNLAAIDEFFVQVFNEEMESARKVGDLERISKLKQVEEVVDKASAPPAEVTLVEELVEAAASDQELNKKIEEHKKEITPELMDVLTSLVARTEAGDDPELKKRMNAVYSAVLRISMAANLG